MKRFLLCLIVIFLVQNPVESQQAGTLDTSFGADGLVITSAQPHSSITDMEIDSAGRIIATGTGSATANGSKIWLTTRYLPDGTLDTTFGTSGTVITSLGGDDVANALTIDQNGKIVVVGSYNKTQVAIVRYNLDGTPDTTFSSDGQLLDSRATSAEAVTIDTNNKIIIVGNLTTPTDTNVAIFRYNVDGTPDATFDSDGLVIADLGSYEDRAFAVLLDGSGKILVAGDTNDNIALLRYHPDGTPDTTFDGDGLVITDFGVDEGLLDVKQDANGKLVGLGTARTSQFTFDFILTRYNVDGTLDTTFDTDGRVMTNLSLVDAATDLAITSGGKLIAAGFINAQSNADFALVRYNADGSIDSAFGNDGKVIQDASGGFDAIRAVAIDQDERIVAAGYSGITQTRFTLARYHGVTTRQTELLTNGGFEINTDGNRIPDGWTSQHGTKDLLICQPQELIYEGNCAYRFKGFPGENSVLHQTPVNSSFQAGDTLTFSAFVRATQTPDLLIKVRIVYADQSVEPLKVRLQTSTGDFYQQISETLTLTNAIKRMKIRVIHRSPTGRLYLDQLQLVHTRIER